MQIHTQTNRRHLQLNTRQVPHYLSRSPDLGIAEAPVHVVPHVTANKLSVQNLRIHANNAHAY